MAVIALVLNMLMLMAIMMSIKAAFTLSGFAGLALTVGMAVDNNVLVFERLREELERGATLRMAIRNAFHRAGTTIIDCNLTHLIAATVLYLIGSDQIKGFAVTLWLGTVISIYTSVFVAHVIFDVAEKRQWVTKLKMHARYRAHEHRLHGLVPLRDGSIRSRSWPSWCRLPRPGACSTSTSPAAFRCRRCSTSRRRSPRSAPRWKKTGHLPDVVISDVQLTDEPRRTAVRHQHLRIRSRQGPGRAEAGLPRQARYELDRGGRADCGRGCSGTRRQQPRNARETGSGRARRAAEGRRAEESRAGRETVGQAGPCRERPSRYELPPGSMLAMAGDSPLLVPQAAPPGREVSAVLAANRAKPVGGAGNRRRAAAWRVEIRSRSKPQDGRRTGDRGADAVGLESTSSDVTNLRPEMREGDIDGLSSSWDVKISVAAGQDARRCSTRWPSS